MVSTNHRSDAILSDIIYTQVVELNNLFYWLGLNVQQELLLLDAVVKHLATVSQRAKSSTESILESYLFGIKKGKFTAITEVKTTEQQKINHQKAVDFIHSKADILELRNTGGNDAELRSNYIRVVLYNLYYSVNKGQLPLFFLDPKAHQAKVDKYDNKYLLQQRAIAEKLIGQKIGEQKKDSENKDTTPQQVISNNPTSNSGSSNIVSTVLVLGGLAIGGYYLFLNGKK